MCELAADVCDRHLLVQAVIEGDIAHNRVRKAGVRPRGELCCCGPLALADEERGAAGGQEAGARKGLHMQEGCIQGYLIVGGMQAGVPIMQTEIPT